MKRSNINATIKETIEYLNDKNFYLPEWAYWTFDEWKSNKSNCTLIFKTGLGWDMTLSSNKNSKEELVLFTIRNGVEGDDLRPYCEKIIVMDKGQVIPYHYHVAKTEDIINRSKNEIAFKIFNAMEKNADSLEIMIDGIVHQISKNQEIVLRAGQSLTLMPYFSHTFYPVSEKVLIGEVSKVNNDTNDNFFMDSKVQRFPAIEEDEEILYPLVVDYDKM